MSLSPQVAPIVHRAEVVQNRRERHPHAPRHLGGGQRSLLEQQAIDRVLVGAKRDVGQGGGQQTADSLVDHEQVEQE